MKNYKLICMSFDGDYITEGEFQSISAAWERSNDMGSRWYFYPFHFVVSASGKTVVDAGDLLEHFKHQRVATVAKTMKAACVMPEMQNANAEDFAFFLISQANYN